MEIPDFIYPKDAQGNSLCPRCRKPVKDCDCPEVKLAAPKRPKIVPKIRLEKSGRKGKTVTVIAGLPRNDAYLKDAASQLKAKTGSGGTHYFSDEGGVIEIQGDHKAGAARFFEVGNRG